MTILGNTLTIDKATFDALEERGLLKSTARRDLEIYEYYAAQRNKYGSMQAITNTSEKFCISESTVEKIIYNKK